LERLAARSLIATHGFPQKRAMMSAAFGVHQRGIFSQMRLHILQIAASSVFQHPVHPQPAAVLRARFEFIGPVEHAMLRLDGKKNCLYSGGKTPSVVGIFAWKNCC
jgi:hypothetical protein